MVEKYEFSKHGLRFKKNLKRKSEANTVQKFLPELNNDDLKLFFGALFQKYLELRELM